MQTTDHTTEVNINGAPFPVSTIDLMRLISDGDRRKQAEQSLGVFKGMLDSIAQSFSDPTTLALPAKIGEKLQGGVYVGPYFDLETGKVEHMIGGDYLDDSDAPDAEAAAARHQGGGYTDWRLPTQQEAMAAFINAKKCFKPGYHWTSTPYGSDDAWVVGFENGNVGTCFRGSSFRVRLFRRFIA